MKTPLVSVIVPLYNCKLFVNKSITSILNQSFGNFELIVVNDASTDSSATLVSKFKDRRIKVVHNLRRLGVAASLNHGLQLARGSLIARMDADDVALPHRFANQIEFLNRTPSAALVGSWVIIVNEKGKKLGVKKPPGDPRIIKSVIMRYNPFIHSTVMMRKSILKSVGGYNERYNGAEDYDLFLKIARKYKLANIEKPLLLYRLSRAAVTFRQMKKVELRSLQVRINALRSYGYPISQATGLLKPALSYVIPASVKQIFVYGFQ